VERQNVTLAIPKDLLRRARLLAVESNSSLSGLLVRALEDSVVRATRYADAHHAHEIILEEGLELGLNERIRWSRDELHRR
jgi:hypothetical protein